MPCSGATGPPFRIFCGDTCGTSGRRSNGPASQRAWKAPPAPRAGATKLRPAGGSVPALPSSRSRREELRDRLLPRKVAPLGIVAFDQIELPLARPLLQRLFALDSVADALEELTMYELGHAIFLSEAGHQSLLVLIDSSSDVVCYSYIERSIATACEYVDAEGLRTPCHVALGCPAQGRA